MLRVALTGGIATGKSHVLARFAALGAPAIDADTLAHQALAPEEPAGQAVRARFGSAVIGPDGAIDRRRLGAVVFADPAARRELEALVHPHVYAAIQRWFAALPDTTAIAVADIPLLFETGHQHDFDRIVVTACHPETQLARLKRRDGLSDVETRRRLDAQWPTADKVARADFVVWTDGSLEETDRQVEEIYRTLLSAAQ